MRIREKPLEPWVILRSDGSVDSAHCTCMAGLGECCSHVGAVLFALETGTRIRKEVSVTDVPAYWMFPTSTKFDTPYMRVRDMDLQSAAKKRKLSQSDEVATSTSVLKQTDIPSPTKHEENLFFEELNRVMPTSAILSLTDKFSENFVPVSVSEKWPKDLSSFLKTILMRTTRKFWISAMT